MTRNGVPTVKNIKIYAIIEQTLEASADPQQVVEYLRKSRFSGNAEVKYDANYNQGGIRSVVTKEHIPLTMAELDKVLAARNGA
jgi:hypothetical protein